MSTPVVDVVDALVTLWTGLTPPDRTSVTYHHLDHAEVESWEVLDRGFRFALPVRAAPAGQSADATKTLAEWVVVAQYHVARRGRGFLAFAKAVANETSQLAVAVESKASWPAGVGNVFVEPVSPEEETEGAVVTFTFTVLTEDS